MPPLYNFFVNFHPIGKLAAFGIACSLLAVKLASADLYWCQVDEANSALVEERIEGKECRLVAKDEPKEEKQQEQPADGDELASSNIPSKDEEGFPVVTPQEQAGRDQTRSSILRFELSQESEKLKNLRELIQRNKLGEGSQQLHDFYVVRFRRHSQNVKALQQEIARLP